MSALRGFISIRGLRCRGRQGTSAIAQEREHDYLVDVTLAVDVADAVARDELAASIDIAEIAACVRDEMARRPRVLLERLTADVARALLGRFARADEVRVKVEKLSPDDLGAAGEAVELSLPRERS